MIQYYKRSCAYNMACRLSRFYFSLALTFIFIGTQGKHVHKRSFQDIKCHENGRFYRNPDRDEDTMWNAVECSKYYLCLENEVFEFRCSKGLLFDVNRQLCDMYQNVHNCDLTTETLVPKPLLDSAKCANETHLGCSDETCIPAEYFCDGANDCSDYSDEGWCDVNYDPNAALPCDPGLCQLPNCFCTKYGNATPGNLIQSQVKNNVNTITKGMFRYTLRVLYSAPTVQNFVPLWTASIQPQRPREIYDVTNPRYTSTASTGVFETPQMITLTFDGPVNHENWDIYAKQILTSERKNPNGCPIKATFFISHPYTNYRHVQKLWNDDHEIAVHSITHRGPEEWWSKNATIEDWFDEMVGQANIINKFGRVWMEEFRGMRVPYLSVGWNRQFLMMQEFGFVYDATVVAPLVDPPFWPYTLDHKMPHQCTGNNQYCPTRSYAGIWEMVINPLKNGDHTCATLEYCPSTLSGEDVYNVLMENFKRHYLKNRAPFGIHLNSTWLKNNEYLLALKKFTDELLRLPDVYFVTYREVIDWMKRPTPVLQLKKFQPWQCKNRRFQESEIACNKPNTCKLPSKVLEQDKYMITCVDCPKSYPWIRNEFGFE